jgi:two-component system, NtrC family, nitrogen regulation sensor histidine kinase NtrY
MTDIGPDKSLSGFEAAASRLLDPSERMVRIGLVTVVLSLISALATFLILTGLTPITPSNEVVQSALIINVLLMLAMIGMIGWQGIGLWQAWQEKIAGARLHVRIVVLFSIIAALPAMLLAFAATTTFSRALDGWFSKNTAAIINNSLDIANTYVEEHGFVIRTDITNMARDVDSSITLVGDNPKKLQQVILAQAALRELPSAYVVNDAGEKIISGIEDESIPYIAPPAGLIERARSGETPVVTPAGSSRVATLTKLVNFPGKYLYVSRGVSPAALAARNKTAIAVRDYRALMDKRSGLKLAHGLMYSLISMTALLAAIWAGMWFAGRFVAPIRRLIAGASEVSRGNLLVELPEKRGEGDLRRLSQTFNTMTRELKTQRDDLVTANEQLTDRRRFMEAVLAGVSAGVIGLDSHDHVTLVSRSAEQLLGISEADATGQPLSVVLPMLQPILAHRNEAGAKAKTPLEIAANIKGEDRTFSVRITREKAGSGDVGSVVTVDDITELAAAQRTSAWADVARRIAHEIKNPLTPIILSAERIRRKYGKAITEDRETFEKLTETIERQAGDIKTMVDEFAAFARVPKPVMETGNLNECVLEPMLLFRESHPTVIYKQTLPQPSVHASIDRRLISQALTNLIKNATEAVEAATDSNEPGWKPAVEAILRVTDETIEIDVIDNGIGLPKANRTRLLEPYVTTKGHKGTGLGLAIVQKITEQHGGTLSLEDAPVAPGRTRGAMVRMTLPARLLVDKNSVSPKAKPELGIAAV